MKKNKKDTAKTPTSSHTDKGAYAQKKRTSAGRKKKDNASLSLEEEYTVANSAALTAGGNGAEDIVVAQVTVAGERVGAGKGGLGIGLSKDEPDSALGDELGDDELGDDELGDVESANVENDDLDAEVFDAELMDTDDFSSEDFSSDSINALPVLAKSHLPVATGSKDSLHLYMKEISRFPMLKPDEEHMLAKRVRDHGDTDAAFRLVSSHLRLVVKIAMDFQRRWMQNVLDLIQEGNVGLMRAVNKFDPDKGIKFSYYAAFWIKAYILKFIMNNWRMVKIGTTQVQRKLFYNLNKERQKLISQGFDPDAAMLSERLGVSVDQIHEMDQRLGSADMSLDVQISDDSGGATRMDFLPALGPGVEESFASDEIAKLVQAHLQTILPKLNEKETFILQKRLLSDEPLTLREIGERYNVTRERVRQLEARLLEKLRAHLSNDIQDFSEEWITN